MIKIGIVVISKRIIAWERFKGAIWYVGKVQHLDLDG